MYIRVLGEVRIEAADGIVPLRRSAERCVLAALAFNVGRPVRVGTLAERVWGERLPAKADESIAGYVRATRRAIAAAGGGRDAVVNRRPHAYELRVDPESIDYHQFRSLVATGRDHVRREQHREAVDAFRAAAELWTDVPMADLPGDWADRRREALRREHLDVLCALFEEQLRTGDPAAVVERARQVIDETVPTDRVLVLALHGLAGSGHVTAIPGFVEQVTQRVLDATGVPPGQAVAALARRLVTDSRSADTLVGPAVLPPMRPEVPAVEEGSSLAQPDSASRSAVAPEKSVTMVASGNGQVFQSGGDQIITGV
jgi:DNA-binding SARP family transcriptional activator